MLGGSLRVDSRPEGGHEDGAEGAPSAAATRRWVQSIGNYLLEIPTWA
jgi:hypothetical protein